MFKDLIKLASKSRFKLTVSCIFLVLGSILSIIPFLLIYWLLLDFFSPPINQAYIWNLVAIIPIAYILSAILLIYAYDISHRAAYEILYDVRIELGEKMVQLPLGYFNEKNTGEMGTIMNENVERLEFFLAHHLPEIIATIFVTFFFGVLLFILDWRMALASITPVLLVLAIFAISSQKWSDMVEDFLTSQSKVNSTIMEYTQGIKAIKAFNQTANSFQKYRKNMAKWCDRMIKWSTDTAIYFTLYHAFITSTLAVIIPVGLWLYQRNTLSLEMFLFFLLIGPLFGAFFTRIYQFLRYWLEEKECMDRVNKLLNAQVIKDCNSDKYPSSLDITFKDVSFSYEENREKVLEKINFHVPEGNTYAIVGPSGTGKSTIARLITRFWDVDDGEINIGEYNVKNLPLERLLSYISLVFQEVFLFNDTILENIRLGKPEATEEEVKLAAHASKCDKFINQLPEGYNTVIGEKGAMLSTGEKQRISIARAILKDAPIIILDEATAFVDPENENVIQEAINNLTMEKTVLIIAHRLSTITHVDQIIVMEKGRIAEQGTHEELLKAEGFYKKMWDAHISALGWGIRRIKDV